MRVSIINGCIVADWENKPNKPILNNDDLLRTLPQKGWAFFNDLRDANYDLNEPYVDLRYGSYVIPYTPYRAYRALWWVSYWAKVHDIEIDGSFERVYAKLREQHNKAVEEETIKYDERMTAKAEKLWEESKSSNCDTCDGCHYCADVIDGDLMCMKYRRYLEINVREKITASGQHLTYASQGIPIEKCVEEKTLQRQAEKTRFINAFLNEYRHESIEDAVANAMNKGVVSYV